MICNYCGMQLPDGTTFCPNCGTPTATQPQAYPQEQQQSYYQAQTYPQGQQQGYYQGQQPYDQARQGYYQGQQPYSQAQQGYYQGQQPYSQAQQDYYQAQQQAYDQTQQPQAYAAAPGQTAPAAKKRRSPLPAILIVAILAALAAVVVLVVLPKLQKSKQYDNALQSMEEGMYDKAIDNFEALGDYSDAPEKILEAKYRKAGSLLEAGRYEDAMALYRELGDYADSKNLIDEAKYQFVKQNFDKENRQTMGYLEELRERGYKDAAELYAELCAWRLTLTCLNTDPDDESTVDGVISKYVDYLHLRGSLEGGAPGEQVKGKLVLALPDGSLTDLEELDGVLEAGKDFACELDIGFFAVPGTVTGGASQLQIRDTDSDELIAAWDFELSDEHIWKVKLLYSNTEEDDMETIADSVSKYTPYYHHRFRVYGGNPKDKLNITTKYIYPDGSDYIRESFWTGVASGEEPRTYWSGFLIKQPDLMPAGTMTIELYNADTDDLLGAFEVQLTDEAVAEPVFKGAISLKFSGDDPEDMESVTKSISRYASYFHYGYYDSDASSSGEVSLRNVTVYPNGESYSQTITCNFDEDEWYWGRWPRGLANARDCSQAGLLIEKYYDAVSNQLVGEFSFEVTDDKPEGRGYADKITSTFINGKSNDTTTTAESIGTDKYLHFGFKLKGAASGETLNIQVSLHDPDGTWGVFLFQYTVQKDGTILFDRMWKNGFSSPGTLEIYLYDHDSYELLASYSIEITD